MSQVRIDIDEREVKAGLAQLARNASDLREPLDTLGFAFSQRVGSTFGAQADPYDRAWTPLSPVTLALRNRGGDAILRDTGALANSITHEVSGDSVDVGTNLLYASAQQFGNPANRIYGKGSAPIPARMFLPTDGVPGDWAAEAIDIFSDHLEPAR